MADENNQDTAENSADTAEAAAPAKKTRQPRKPKAPSGSESLPQATSDQSSKKSRAKRGSKIAAGKVPGASGRSAISPVAGSNTTSSPIEQIDEFAELMRLEEENKMLRKQLSDKLRADNADLRKRLGQN